MPRTKKPTLIVIKNEEEIAAATESGEFIDKRVYVPGVTLESACPKCGTVAMRDLAHEYVTQYPVSGKPYPVTFTCDSEGCQAEWTAGKIKYVLTVEWVE